MSSAGNEKRSGSGKRKCQVKISEKRLKTLKNNNNDTFYPGYTATGELTVSSKFGDLEKFPQCGQKVLIGGHLEWYLHVEFKEEGDETALYVTVMSDQFAMYPFSSHIKLFTGVDKSKTKEVVFDKCIPDDRGFVFCSFLNSNEITAKHIAEEEMQAKREKELNITATVEIRLSMCFDFNNAAVFADAKFKVGETIFPINKATLALHSPVLQAMFFGTFKESDEGVIVLEETDARTFCILINAILVCNFDIKNEWLPDLIELACRYQISPLIRECEGLLSDIPIDDNAVSLAQRYSLASMLSLADLKAHCLDLCCSTELIDDIKSSKYYDRLPTEDKLALFDRCMELIKKSPTISLLPDTLRRLPGALPDTLPSYREYMLHIPDAIGQLYPYEPLHLDHQFQHGFF